jgi:Asp-tRNA(Asn)/Glu-tRNA(Gln) amidotransferase A subunit family amidase
MLSLKELCRAIDAGDLTIEAALARQREAIDRLDPGIGAFVHRPGHLLPARAAGPLAGIAVGVKDIIDTADLPTEMGCPAIYGGWRPRADAAIVTMLKAAGGTVAGKTATTPFAFIDPAGTRNPHSPHHTPGGSSSGSAAAVAAGMVPLAIGTQTGGSVIRPAAFCGVAAIKPSFRLLPTVGVKTFSWALDTVGLFAASVPDVAFGLAALSGRDVTPGDDPGTLRIAIVRQRFMAPADDEAEEALSLAARLLDRAGALVREFELPPAVADAHAVHPTLQNFEARHALGWEWREHRAELPPLLRQALDTAQQISIDDYDDARRRSRRGRLALKDVFAERDCDVLLTFSAPGPAPARSGTGDPRFNRLFTILGTPAVNVPVPTQGLPLGLQMVAPFGRDSAALAAGALLERCYRQSDVASRSR